MHYFIQIPSMIIEKGIESIAPSDGIISLEAIDPSDRAILFLNGYSYCSVRLVEPTAEPPKDS